MIAAFFSCKSTSGDASEETSSFTMTDGSISYTCDATSKTSGCKVCVNGIFFVNDVNISKVSSTNILHG